MIDYLYPATITVRASLDRREAQSFAAALRSLANESVVVVSFMDCTFVDLAALAALVAHDALHTSALIVIVPETGYVRSQFQLSDLDSRLGVVASVKEAYERAGRLRLLGDISERARGARILQSTT